MGWENRRVVQSGEDGGLAGEGTRAANVLREREPQGAIAPESSWPFPYRQDLASEPPGPQTANGAIPR